MIADETGDSCGKHATTDEEDGEQTRPVEDFGERCDGRKMKDVTVFRQLPECSLLQSWN